MRQSIRPHRRNPAADLALDTFTRASRDGSGFQFDSGPYRAAASACPAGSVRSSTGESA